MVDENKAGFVKQTIKVRFDASGLACPMPLLKLKQQLNGMQTGELIEIRTTDAGSLRDFPAFLKQVDSELETWYEQGNSYVFIIKK